MDEEIVVKRCVNAILTVDSDSLVLLQPLVLLFMDSRETGWYSDC